MTRNLSQQQSDLYGRMGHDIGDYADLIVRKASQGRANASHRAVAASPSSQSSLSRPSGLPSLSQDSSQEKEAGGQ
jgi:hypothetical protein